jgi:hypothetical protein
MTKRKKWIQKAIKRKGALSTYLERKHADVFNANGTISITKLRKWYKEHENEIDTTTKKRINLFFTLHKLKKKR